MRVSIIVPVFNEELTIGVVLDGLAGLDFDKEVIVVDDGSTDGTRTVIHEHQLDLIVEHLPDNRGKGVAVRRGFEVSTGDIVVMQDADLELSPEVITALVHPIAIGVADAVYGSRFLEKASRVSLRRRSANRLLTGLVNVLYGQRLTDMETAHKAIRADLARRLPLRSERFEIEVELTAHLVVAGARIIEIPSPYSPRTRSDGKKIGFTDGLRALHSIWRWRPSKLRACCVDRSPLPSDLVE